MTAPPARALLLLAALAAAGWLALSYRNAGLLEAAQRVVESPAEVPRQRLDAQRAAVDGARLLNPDRAAPAVLEAGLDRRAGRPRATRLALERLVRAEPGNAGAWVILAGFTRESDPERSARALERARALSPLRSGPPPAP